MFDSILLFIVNSITAVTYYFVIFYKLLLLIMQTIFYFNCWYYFPVIKPFLLFLSPYININIQQGIIEIPSLISYPKPIWSEFLELFDKLNFSKESAIQKNYNLDLDLFTNLNNLMNDYFEFIIVYIWVFFPIILYIGLIYFLHGLFGLYSAYVDYFQKNSDQVKTLRGALPALFIFYFLIFIIFVLLFFFFNLYLIYILWFVYI